MSELDEQTATAPVESDAALGDLVFREDLTGIYNRRFFYRYMKEEIPWGDSDAKPVSLLMIDLDHFKQINDRHGHLEGDNALQHVSKLFCDRIGEAGHVIRYAGDEFSIVLPDADREAAREIGEDILKILAESEFRLEANDRILPLTLSIGVATFPEDGSEPKKFIEAADRALYVSKRQGRNRVSACGDMAEGDGDVRLLDLFPAAKTIGRDRELEIFRGILDAPTWARNTLVLVRAASGMGKTRFLRDVEKESAVRRLTTHWITCEQRDTEQPYFLLAEILGGFARSIPIEHRGRGITRKHRRAIRALVPGFFGEADDGAAVAPSEIADEELVQAGAKFLSRVAAGQPLLLLVDDLQFADSRSLSLLGTLLKEHRVPLVIGGASRESATLEDPRVRSSLGVEPHREYELLSLVETRLSTLKATEVGQLIRALFDGIRVDHTAIHKIWDLTKGNPLFTEEVLKGLLHDELLVQDEEGGWEFKGVDWEDLPATLEEAVRDHIESLDEETADLMARAAVLGSRVGSTMSVTGFASATC